MHCLAVTPLHWPSLARPRHASCTLRHARLGRTRPGESALRPREEYDGGLDYDLGNLMASDPAPVDAERLRADPDGACLELATRITQSLVARLFELPSEARRPACRVLACRSAGPGTRSQGRRAGKRLHTSIDTVCQARGAERHRVPHRLARDVLRAALPSLTRKAKLRQACRGPQLCSTRRAWKGQFA